MKYIIIKDQADKEHGIIFPDSVIHKDVARIHRASDIRVVSAGFCTVGLAGIEVYGESESLHMKHRPEDKLILNSDFGMWLVDKR